MASNINTAESIALIKEIAAKYEAIDKEIGENWMRYPQHVRDKLQELGIGDKFDPLTHAHKLRAVAAEIR